MFAHSPRDLALLLPALAVAVALALTAAPALARGPAALTLWAAAYACWVWWGSNTVAHNHLHNPLFRSRAANRAFSLALTLWLSIPQTLWRDRHLAHHAGAPPRLRLGRRLVAELALVLGALAALGVAAPALSAALLGGLALGLGLCAAQGRLEHRLDGREHAGGVSTRGRLHNLLWFNDGYHAEHHRAPRRHWSALPAAALPDAPIARHGPLLRPLEGRTGSARGRVLAGLERLALHSPRLQRFLVAAHARALARLIPRAVATPPSRVLIVGGGLFPRTALALATVLPEATLVVMDTDPAHLDCARELLAARGLAPPRVAFRRGTWQPGQPVDAELVVVPLAFEGDRAALYRPTAVPTLVHAFPWEARGLPAEPVSRILLFKRLVAVPARP
ncbi:MAG: fatty acid desaturase [Deltaproteobacteria bacterium]|nr:fatty acid desaturase [Deltaproteobacteria bacterium]MCB9786154.1 fatty acid desaturase [Deltaproteobacteria bacterium]